MKKYFFLIGLALLLIAATNTKAQQMKTPPPPAAPAMHHFEGRTMVNRLNLTSDQRDKMQEMRLQLTKDLIPLRSRIKEKESDLKLMLTSDSYNASKADNILDQISDLQKQVRVKTFNHLRAVRNILTPDQQKKFDMMILNGHWEHRAMAHSWSRAHQSQHRMLPDHNINRK